MASTARTIAPAYHPAKPEARTASGGIARRSDPLDADRIDFDAWLLPPATIGEGERLVRLVSTIAGPVAVLGAVALGLAAIF